MKVTTTDEIFFEEVIKGIKKASKVMAEKSAKNDEELIVADENGNPVSLPAKELLKSLKP